MLILVLAILSNIFTIILYQKDIITCVAVKRLVDQHEEKRCVFIQIKTLRNKENIISRPITTPCLQIWLAMKNFLKLLSCSSSYIEAIQQVKYQIAEILEWFYGYAGPNFDKKKENTFLVLLKYAVNVTLYCSLSVLFIDFFIIHPLREAENCFILVKFPFRPPSVLK